MAAIPTERSCIGQDVPAHVRLLWRDAKDRRCAQLLDLRPHRSHRAEKAEAMTRAEEKAWSELRKHRDALAKSASRVRTSFVTKETQVPAMAIAARLQCASDAIDLEMMKLDTGNLTLTEFDLLQVRVLEP